MISPHSQIIKRTFTINIEDPKSKPQAKKKIFQTSNKNIKLVISPQKKEIFEKTPFFFM